MGDQINFLLEHLFHSGVPVVMDAYTFQILSNFYPAFGEWIIERRLAPYAHFMVMAFYGFILMAAMYILTNSFNQYIAIFAMSVWAIMSCTLYPDFQGLLLWAAIVVLGVRSQTSRGRGVLAIPEFASGRKMELDPLVPVVVLVMGLGSLLTPKDSNIDASHTFFGLGVVLLMYMFVKTMGGVGQHANIYSIIPFILVFVLCVSIMPVFAELFHTLVKVTRFRPTVYLPEEDLDMTPVSYFGGLFDTLQWFEGGTSKMAFFRLTMTYAFMCCMACDEIIGPTSKLKAALTCLLKMDKVDGAIRGIAGNFNSMWVYAFSLELVMSFFTHSYLRMAAAIAGFSVGYFVQLGILKPIWQGRGMQNCLTKLRSGMSFCLGDAFQGGRRLILRMMTSCIILTYMVTGHFDQMIMYMFLCFVAFASDKGLISVFGLIGGNWTLVGLGFLSDDPLMSSAEDNSQLNPDSGVGGNSGQKPDTVDITDLPRFMLKTLKKGRYFYNNKVVMTSDLVAAIMDNEIYFPQDGFVNKCEAVLEKSEGILGDVVRVVALSTVDHKSMVAKEKQ